jgi:hypothetical protein
MAACRPPPAQPAVVPPLIAGCIIEDAGQLAVRQLKSLNYGAGKHTSRLPIGMLFQPNTQARRNFLLRAEREVP